MAKRTTWKKKKPEDLQKTCSGSKMPGIAQKRRRLLGEGVLQKDVMHGQSTWLMVPLVLGQQILKHLTSHKKQQ